MVCTSLGSLLRPLFYFLCSILLIHRVRSGTCWYVVLIVGKLSSRGAMIQDPESDFQLFVDSRSGFGSS